MISISESGAVAAVRKNIDEQGVNSSAMYGESVDNMDFEAIVKETIPEAIDRIMMSAPAETVDDEAVQTDVSGESVADGVLSFGTEKPVLRVVSFQANDSDIVLPNFVPAVSPFARMQFNRYVRGTSDNPVLVMKNGDRKHFRYYTVAGNPGRIPVKVADHLYKTSYERLDYDYAREYFLTKNPDVNIGACTSVRSGEWFGRNLDWRYDNGVDVAVQSEAHDGRHAVCGIAGGLPGLTVDIAESGRYSELYRILPFYLQDGINDRGVFASVNVVPLDHTPTTVTVPAVSEQDRICGLMLVRYVLDNFSSASEAVEWLRDHCAIYFPKALQDMDYETHWMIGDGEATYVVEIIDNAVVILERAIMTNFYLDGVTPGADGTVYTNEDAADGDLPSSMGITEHGSGLERYNIAVAGHPDVHSAEDMRNLLDSMLFTKAYRQGTDPYWFSDFVGGDITVDTPSDDPDMAARVARYQHEYTVRSRDNGRTWHTTHSVVYDLDEMAMEIVSQEETDSPVALSFGFSSGTYVRHIAYATYAVESRVQETQGSQTEYIYKVSDALADYVIYKLTAMVLSIYGETDAANYFNSLISYE